MEHPPHSERLLSYALAILTSIALALVVITRCDFYVSRYVVALIVSMLIACSVAGVYIVGGKTNWRAENLFLVLYAVLGLFTLLFIPPGSTPDAQSHYARAWEIAQGHFLSLVDPQTGEGILPAGTIPFGINDELRMVLGSLPTNVDPTAFETHDYANTALYSPFSYLPAAVGIFVAQLFTSNAWALVFAARITSFLCVGCILFFAIRAMPTGKTIFSLAALLPMSVEMYTSITADMVTIALLYALFAYAMHLRSTKTCASVPLLVLLVSLVSLSKIVYLPMVLLILLIPVDCFSSPRARIVTLCALFAVALLLNLGWLTIASSYLIEIKPGVNGSEQIAFILAHPLSFIAICLRTVLDGLGDWVMEMFGSRMNYLDVIPAFILPVSLLVTFTATSAHFAFEGTPTDRNVRLLIGCATALVIALTLTSLYVQWTPVENGTVEGVQGRYLTPLLPFAIIAALPGENDWKPSFTWALVACIIALIFIYPLEISL